MSYLTIGVSGVVTLSGGRIEVQRWSTFTMDHLAVDAHEESERQTTLCRNNSTQIRKTNLANIL